MAIRRYDLANIYHALEGLLGPETGNYRVEAIWGTGSDPSWTYYVIANTITGGTPFVPVTVTITKNTTPAVSAVAGTAVATMALAFTAIQTAQTALANQVSAPVAPLHV